MKPSVGKCLRPSTSSSLTTVTGTARHKQSRARKHCSPLCKWSSGPALAPEPGETHLVRPRSELPQQLSFAVGTPGARPSRPCRKGTESRPGTRVLPKRARKPKDSQVQEQSGLLRHFQGLHPGKQTLLAKNISFQFRAHKTCPGVGQGPFTAPVKPGGR